MVDKDFLNQFSDEANKPTSFKEEERIKVTVERKPVNTKAILIVLAIILAVVGLILFLVLRPSIEVKDFIGADVSEVKSWIVQNEIEIKGIVLKEEFNSEYNEGEVFYQSVEPNTKVRKDTKMDFKVSKGADPDEIISVPEIESMFKEEIQEWIRSNKLTKTKISSEYSDVYDTGAVISYEFKNSDAQSFTRSSTLNIVCSKGPKPVGIIVVEDFVKKDFSVVEEWGKKNGIEIIKTTKFDDKVAKDLVISQSVEAKKDIKQGESLSVIVSLGKGVVVPNFAKMSKDDIKDWIKDNSAYVKTREKYSYEDKYILEQSVGTGQYIGEDKKLVLTINLGNHFYLDDIGFNSMTSYDRFKDKSVELEEKGLYIDTHKTAIDSDKPYGTILGVEDIFDKDGKHYSSIQRLPLEVEVTCYISNGMLEEGNILIKESYIKDGNEYSWKRALDEKNPYTEAKVRKLCDLAGVKYAVDVEILESGDKDIDQVVSITVGDYAIVEKINQYIGKDDIVRVSVKKYTKPVEPTEE